MSLPINLEKEKNPSKTVKYNRKNRVIDIKLSCEISNFVDINSDDMMKMPKEDLMNYVNIISKRAKVKSKICLFVHLWVNHDYNKSSVSLLSLDIQS